MSSFSSKKLDSTAREKKMFLYNKNRNVMRAPIIKSEGPYLGGAPYGEIYAMWLLLLIRGSEQIIFDQISFTVR